MKWAPLRSLGCPRAREEERSTRRRVARAAAAHGSVTRAARCLRDRLFCDDAPNALNQLTHSMRTIFN